MCNGDGATKDKKIRVRENCLEQGKQCTRCALNEAWVVQKVP